MDHNQLLQLANEAIREGNLDKAQRAISEVLSERPDDANAWFLSSYTTSDITQQIIALERALLSDPTHAQALTRRDRIMGRFNARTVLPSNDYTSVAKPKTDLGVLALEWIVAMLIGWTLFWGAIGVTGTATEINLSVWELLIVYVVPIAFIQWLVFRDVFKVGISTLFLNIAAWAAGLGILFTGFISTITVRESYPLRPELFIIVVSIGAFAGFTNGAMQLPIFIFRTRYGAMWPLINTLIYAVNLIVVTAVLFSLQARGLQLREALIVAGIAGGLVCSLLGVPLFVQLVRWRKTSALTRPKSGI